MTSGPRLKETSVRMVLLYVLALTAPAAALDLTPASKPGFGETSNRAITAFAAGEAPGGIAGTLQSAVGLGGPTLFAGTWNMSTGGQVWRSGNGGDWEKIGAGGFGQSGNFRITSLAWFQDRLYAGTWNIETGGQLYRCMPGGPEITWERITGDGFGDAANESVSQLAVLGEFLYAAVFNAKAGVRVYRSETGHKGAWSHAAPPALGVPSTSDASAVLVHAGRLYLGTEALRPPYAGGLVMRTDGQLAPPFGQWQRLSVAGFSYATNQSVSALAAFEGKLYAGTWNAHEGLQVWTATLREQAPLGDWTAQVHDGISTPANLRASALSVLDAKLYLGALGRFEVEGRLLSAEAQAKNPEGGGLFVLEEDGDAAWRPVDAEGFLERPLLGVQTMTVFDGKLYVALLGIGAPGELWVLDP